MRSIIILFAGTLSPFIFTSSIVAMIAFRGWHLVIAIIMAAGNLLIIFLSQRYFLPKPGY